MSIGSFYFIKKKKEREIELPNTKKPTQAHHHHDIMEANSNSEQKETSPSQTANPTQKDEVGLQEDSAMFVEKLEKKLESLSQKKIKESSNSADHPEQDIEVAVAQTTTLEENEDEDEDENLIEDGLADGKDAKKKKAFYLNLLKKEQKKKKPSRPVDSDDEDDDDDDNDFLVFVKKTGKRFLKTFCFCLFPERHEDGDDYIHDPRMELEETIMNIAQ